MAADFIRDTEALQRARQAFADQFEAAGDAILYRWRGRAAPVAVTGWERDALVDEFNRRIGRLYVVVVVLLVAGLAATGAAALLLHRRPTPEVIAFVILPAGLVYFGLDAWMWNAPRRRLKGRAADSGDRQTKGPPDDA